MEARMVPQAVLQNLRDAGCSNDIIKQYCEMEAQERSIDLIHRDQQRLLAKQRKELLDDLHQCQRKLDCLDFLLYQMKNQWENAELPLKGECDEGKPSK